MLAIVEKIEYRRYFQATSSTPTYIIATVDLQPTILKRFTRCLLPRLHTAAFAAGWTSVLRPGWPAAIPASLIL